jgi:outer membrane protein
LLHDFRNNQIMNAIKSFLFICILFCVSSLIAQTASTNSWTLEQCIQYAMDHNLTIKQAVLDVNNAEINLSQSKREYLPTLNGGASQSFSNGSVIDPITSDFVSRQVSSTSLDLNAGITLFNGFKTQSQIKQNKLLTEQSRINFEKTENNIKLSILEAYLQVMYAEEGIIIAQNSLLSYEKQLEKAKGLLQSKSITLKDFTEVQSQVANAQYDLINAKKNKSIQILTLKQLLEIAPDVEFSIITDQEILNLDHIAVPDKNMVYLAALQTMPEIKSGDLNIKVTEQSLRISRSSYYPTLSLSAGLGTGYTNSQNLIFKDQLTGNFNQRIGLSLSIPIYDKGNTRSNIQKGKNQLEVAQIERVTLEKEMYQKVETAWLNGTAAQEQMDAARVSLNAAKQVLEAAETNFQNGNLTATDLIIAQNAYVNAEIKYIQTQYMTMLYIQILNYYQGKPIKF